MTKGFIFRPIEPRDRETLADLVRAYYLFDELVYDEALHGPAIDLAASGDPAARTWMIEYDGYAAGYLIITIGFSMYYGGRDGFIDELFLTEEFRGRGGGRAIMDFAENVSRELDLKYLHLEVTTENDHARSLYERRGFAPTGHMLMSKPLN